MLRLVRTRTGYRRFHRPARRVPHVDLRYNLSSQLRALTPVRNIGPTPAPLC
jgi:hypothetical protein